MSGLKKPHLLFRYQPLLAQLDHATNLQPLLALDHLLAILLPLHPLHLCSVVFLVLSVAAPRQLLDAAPSIFPWKLLVASRAILKTMQLLDHIDGFLLELVGSNVHTNVDPH